MITKEESDRFIKMVNWGIKNNIVVRFSTFTHYNKDKKPTRLYEVSFLEVFLHSNAGHRSSTSLNAESLSNALDQVWKDYKRKGSKR